MAEVLAVKNGVVLPHDMEMAQAKNERAVLGNDVGDLVCGTGHVWRLKIALNTPVDVNWAKTAVETVALVVVV